MPRLSELSSLGAPSGASRLAGASSLGGASGSYGMPEVAAYVVENASVLAQFGAKGDGITDDTPAFQAAVNSVASGKAIAIGVPSKTYLLNSDVVDNGRFPIFCIAPGAALTGAGVLRCRAEWWTDPYKKAHRGSIAWAFGGQRGGEGQGALLIGGGDPYEGLGGNYLFADGNGNWTAIITSRQDNPTEFNVYGASAGGRCTVLTGGNTITRQTGDLWTVNRVKYWIGRAIGLDYGIYVIDARIDDNTLRLKNIDGSAVVWNGNARLTYHFVLTTGDGTCTVAGTTVTRASGTPFNPFIDPSLYSFYTSTDGGTTWVKRTISAYVSPSQLTLSASLTAGSYLYRYEQDINQQIATVRIQKLNGGIEENLTLAAKTYEYEIRVGAGGSDPSDTGSYHPLTFYNGSTGPFAPKAMAQIGDGYVSLGGRLGSDRRASCRERVCQYV